MIGFTLIYLFLINIYGFLVINLDKRKAIKGKWRIKESRLFFTAIIGGSLGVYLGIHIFRHKTKHDLFKYGIPLLIVVQIILLSYFI